VKTKKLAPQSKLFVTQDTQPHYVSKPSQQKIAYLARYTPLDGETYYYTLLLKHVAARHNGVSITGMLHVPGVAMSYTNLNICTQVGINGLLSANNVTHTYQEECLIRGIFTDDDSLAALVRSTGCQGSDKALGSATGEAHSGHAQLAKVVVWTSKMQHQAAGQMPLHTAVYIMVRAGVAGAEAVLTTCWVLTRLARRCRAAISLRRWQLARRCSSRLRRWTCTAMVRWCCCCRGCQHVMKNIAKIQW